MIKSICVFIGSHRGHNDEYAEITNELGKVLAAHQIKLIYGGASVGLMGILADSVLKAGGDVIGVIPHQLFRREMVHTNLTILHKVDSMHERKAMMFNLADAFLALPGGFGTLDELFEIITWAQIGLHHKPIGLLNIANYFDPLLKMVTSAIEHGFIPSHEGSLFLCRNEIKDIIDLICLSDKEP